MERGESQGCRAVTDSEMPWKAVELRAHLRIADDLQHERGGGDTTALLALMMMMMRGVAIIGMCGNGLQSIIETIGDRLICNQSIFESSGDVCTKVGVDRFTSNPQ